MQRGHHARLEHVAVAWLHAELKRARLGMGVPKAQPRLQSSLPTISVIGENARPNAVEPARGGCAPFSLGLDLSPTLLVLLPLLRA